MDFFDDESDSDCSLKINEDYAKRYDKWRKNEELQKLKDKYGDDFDGGESSTSEEEDEEAVELTEEVEKDFFKTLSCLKEKNPKIYDDKIRFFKEKPKVEGGESNKAKKPKVETLTMAAYHRKLLLETGGVIEEAAVKFEDMPLVEQEKALKESFVDALKDSDDETDVLGGLLKEKTKSKEETDKEEHDYRQWLAGQEAKVNKEEARQLKGLRDYWSDPNLDEGEAFLRDYILNKRYRDEDDGKPEDDVFESEDEVEKQEEFEHKYNFRFEEPDIDFIKRYPRTIEQSMRKKDDKRKTHREEVKARKIADRAKKDEELKRLKALKRAEIIEKIKQLQDVTGNEQLPFQETDLEGDFNPEEHDRRMSELFSDNFYDDTVDEEKPEFHELDKELEIENWDEWEGPNESAVVNENLHCEDPDFVMDCDYDPKAAAQQELLESTKNRKKRRQSKFAAAVARPKPIYDPSSKTFEQYLNDYYALDYEDLIGDIPCRFKYRKVVPNDFGLTVEEILSAPDKELNSWVSVKRIMQRRPEHVEQNDVSAFKRKALNEKKKMQCLPSLYAPTEDEELQPSVSSKKKIKTKENSSNITELNLTDSFADDKMKKKEKNLFHGKGSKASPAQNPKINKRKGEAVFNFTEVKNSNFDKQITKKQKKKISPTQNVLSVSQDKSSENSGFVESNVVTKKKKKKRKVKEIYQGDISSEQTPLFAEMQQISSAPENNKPPNKKQKLVNKLPDSPLAINVKSPTNKKKKNKSANSIVSNAGPASATILPSKESTTKKKKKKKNQAQNDLKALPKQAKMKKKKSLSNSALNTTGDVLTAISDARLKSYGINPKKFKNKMKYGKK